MSKWLYATIAALLVLCAAQVSEAHPYGYGYGVGGCGGGGCGGGWNSCNYDHLWAGYCGQSRGCGSRGGGWQASLWSGHCGQSCCNVSSCCRPRCSFLGGLRLRRAGGLGCGLGSHGGCAATTSCGCDSGCGTTSYGTTSYSGCCGGTSGGTVITHEENIEMAPPEESVPLDAPPALDEAPPAAPSDDAAAALGRYNWSALQSPALYR